MPLHALQLLQPKNSNRGLRMYSGGVCKRVPALPKYLSCGWLYPTGPMGITHPGLPAGCPGPTQTRHNSTATFDCSREGRQNANELHRRTVSFIFVSPRRKKTVIHLLNRQCLSVVHGNCIERAPPCVRESIVRKSRELYNERIGLLSFPRVVPFPLPRSPPFDCTEWL